MWVKNYRGCLYNLNDFSRFTIERRDIKFTLCGVSRNKDRVDLLSYVTLIDSDIYCRRALDAIESGIKNGAHLIDLSGICDRFEYV